ncbi:MAG: hypothetical protein IKZ04_00415 [Spirochaetaceae bacterium]|nr:hypothetical protein [Spirochaetaceae bacterium]
MGVFLYPIFPKFNAKVVLNMVHTATLTYLLDSKEKADLYEKFKKIPGSYYAKQEYKWCNSTLKSNGITLWAYKLDTICYGVLVMRINFIRLVEQQNRIAVLAEADIPRIEKKFNELMDNLLPGLPYFAEWKVNRLDYCVNIHTEHVAQYIKLLHKANIPTTMKQKRDDNGNYKFQDGSFYLISKARDRRFRKTGSKTYNFYDKYQELQNQLKNGEPNVTAEVVEQGKNILRLEVQCFKPGLEYLKVKNKYPTKQILYYLNPQTGYEIIDRAICLSCGYADFQRKKTARQMIDAMKCQDKTKHRLHQLINDISRTSWQKVKKSYISSGLMTEATFRYYINLLQKNNINPITIDKNVSLPGKKTTDGLRSLWELFDEAYTAEPFLITDTADDFDIDSFVKEDLKYENHKRILD